MYFWAKWLVCLTKCTAFPLKRSSKRQTDVLSWGWWEPPVGLTSQKSEIGSDLMGLMARKDKLFLKQIGPAYGLFKSHDILWLSISAHDLIYTQNLKLTWFSQTVCLSWLLQNYWTDFDESLRMQIHVSYYKINSHCNVYSDAIPLGTHEYIQWFDAMFV